MHFETHKSKRNGRKGNFDIAAPSLDMYNSINHEIHKSIKVDMYKCENIEILKALNP